MANRTRAREQRERERMAHRQRREREKRQRQQELALWEQARSVPRDVLAPVLTPGTGPRRLQLVYDPAFETGFAWDICARESVWRLFRSDLSFDCSYVSRMKATGYDELDAPADMLKGYFDAVRALTLPVGPLISGEIGRDGTGYQLALFGDLLSEVRFQWWSDFPPQWAPLVKIANELIDVFRRLPTKLT
jgi:hypothetical protein